MSDLRRQAERSGVTYLRLIFADILGHSKNVVVPISRLDDALGGGVTFDGGSIDGFARDQEIDMVLRPDQSTFAILPTSTDRPTEARLLCDLTGPDGEPFEGCPRSTLRRVLDHASAMLPGLSVGLEVEFYLFDAIEQEELPRSDDSGSYFDLASDDRGERVRTAIVAALESMGIAVASSHHEHGAGQHEIELAPTGALAAGDNLLTLRMIAKSIAAQHGMHATFMPKPLTTSAGNGLHLFFSWQRDELEREAPTPSARVAGGGALEPPLESEAAYAREEELDLDAQELQAALHDLHAEPDERLFAVGGILAHACACTAICNPTINSYKRLVAAWDAPIATVWSYQSANALIRIPHDRGGRRLEMRSPDPSCNPYLALAVLIASIVDGLRKKMLPGAPWTGSTYAIAEALSDERGIRKLPRSLRAALEALAADPIVHHALGDHIFHAFREAKHAEYEEYRRAVHPWERQRYLRTY